jgi:hypothetical protein
MDDNSNQNSFSDRREERRERRQERRGGGEWMLGIILILLAGVVLLNNMKIFTLHNWWALFILLAAFGSFGTAWRTARSAGHFTRVARGSIIAGIVLVLVTIMFLFSLNWFLLGPILLALAGIGMIINALLPD